MPNLTDQRLAEIEANYRAAIDAAKLHPQFNWDVIARADSKAVEGIPDLISEVLRLRNQMQSNKAQNDFSDEL